MTEQLIKDELYELVLSPVWWLWQLLPTSLQKAVLGIGRRGFLFVLKLIWVVWFWWFVFTLVRAQIPDLSGYYQEYVALGWTWYEQAHAFVVEQLWVKSVGFFFGIYSIAVFCITTLGRRKVESSLVDRVFSGFSSVFQPERAMTGSELIPSKTMPDFLCFIFAVRDGIRAEFLGMGFRVENAIVTACHVLQGNNDFEIVSQFGSMQVSEQMVHVFPYDDVAYFLLSERDFSILGMSKGSLLSHAVPDGAGIYAQCYGPGNPVSFTMGAVQAATNFGKVTYSGTTGRGFSGTPYIVHKQIVGMHVGAGVVNLGIDAAYLRMLLTGTQESTEDWLLEELERDMASKRRVDWKRSPGDPEEIIVRRQGKYFSMQAEDFFGIYAEQGAVERGNQLSSKLVYDDTKNEFRAPGLLDVNAGASGEMSGNQCFVPTQPGPELKPTQGPSNSSEGISHTGPPGQTLAQLRSASITILPDTSYEPEKTKNRMTRRKRLRQRQLASSTGPGSQGLDLIR